MTPRVERLRNASLDRRPTLSAERAEIVTEAMRAHESSAPPTARAAVFAQLMEHKAVYIGDDELIVGERGPAPKVTPTFPELCCHTLDDLEILHTRERISLLRARRRSGAPIGDRIIPFWHGRSMRDAIFRACRPSGGRPTTRASSPSSWSSARPGTPCSAT